MSWFIEALKKYAVFGGRARRKEYWLFMLFAWLVYVVLATIGAAAHAPYIVGIAVVAFLLPALGVTVRRLHDTGRSGWWILIGIIPLVGPIVLLVFYCSDSEAGANKYGPNPKEVPAFA
ncbi:DUF805 domain-containing protein [Streptomyces diastatochromogenes]|uniref:DUF805 domain-containing protein n=1 Tax=Streptomyces diastatochromogenes TaxID=42236 RepID=A0A233ST18_STRDA|nr:DUF805 domain-containing protein [Streptomyces diastatochromogenes]MCZ0987677.1 DUF805 domain-containing protein [Streptomyces diastatochromogenes]OXY98781.1 hypothetical protein BEK98_08105 [Streptomyces diastatochromogenes]